MRLNKLFFLLVIAALVVSACGTTTVEKVTLNVGWNSEPDSLNPAIGTLSDAYLIYYLVYSTLYVYQPTTTYAPDLVESASVSPDNLTWTFKLRDGVKFSDGQPLTANDVVFSLRFYAAHTNDFPYIPGYVDAFEDATATSNAEVVIKLKQPVPSIEYQLYSLFILPQHVWATLQDPVTFDNKEMIGSGPYKLAEYVPKDHLTLVANPDYYFGRPSVDEIVFKLYSDPQKMVQALLSGEIDLMADVAPESIDTLRADKNIQVIMGVPQSPSLADIVINQVAEENCLLLKSVCSGHPALRDLVVRKALAYATNKQDIIAQVKNGLAVPGLTLIPKGLGAYYNSSLTDYPFDIAQAKQLLDDAGYKDVNGDGIREMPEGQKALQFRVQWPNGYAGYDRMAQLLRDSWKQIGVEAQLQGGVDADTLTNECCPAFDYDIILWSWGSDPDPSLMLRVPLSTNIESGTNETGYANPAYDALFKQQAATTDVAARSQIVWQMQKTLLDDVVYIIPYYSETVQAYRTDKFTGWLTNEKTLSLLDPYSILHLKAIAK